MTRDTKQERMNQAYAIAALAEERRALSEIQEDIEAQMAGVRAYVSTASRMNPTDALDNTSSVSRADLILALEQALLHDGDRRRAMTVLAMAKAEDWAEKELRR